MSRLWEQGCKNCHGTQFFILEYEGPDYEVGLFGGWVASKIDSDPAFPTGWHDELKCLCSFSAEEVAALEEEVALDYGKDDLDYGEPDLDPS